VLPLTDGGRRSTGSQQGFSLSADKQTEGYATLDRFNYAGDAELESILELFADKLLGSLDFGLVADELASSVVQAGLWIQID
jgi:hypothetical protein